VHDAILDWTYSQERSFARTDRRKSLSLRGLSLRTWMDWTDRPKNWDMLVESHVTTDRINYDDTHSFPS
jgi:hypothetical protein